MNCFTVDIGGTNIKWAYFEGDKILKDGYFKTPDKYDAMLEMIQQCSINIGQVDAISAGIPGVYDYTDDKVIFAPNLNSIISKSISKDFSKIFSKPCFVENDANLAALGEYYFYEKDSIKNMLFITLGTGVGGGAVVNGNILSGRFSGVELGHVTLDMNGRNCNCGKHGCLEAYCGMSGLLNTYKEIAGNGCHITFNELLKLRNLNDIKAVLTFKEFAFHLASGISSAINILTPEKIKIGGGLSEVSVYFLKDVIRNISKLVFPAFKGKFIIELANLKNKAALYGGAAYWLSNMNKNV